MISVVIPAYNEEALLGTCLESLTRQDTSEPFEVIVIDNGSHDQTRHIAEQYRNKLSLHVLVEHRKGRGIARKRGFDMAQGDIIFSTDADCSVPPHWIRFLSKQLQDQQIDAATGTCTIADCFPLTNFLFNHLYQKSTELFYRIVHGHWCLIGPNFAIKRLAYLRSGGFDIMLNCREDADLSAQVSKHGNIKRISLAVNFSGRRYQKGLIKGSFPYLRNQFLALTRGKAHIILEDIR